jgi:hypothetical protein
LREKYSHTSTGEFPQLKDANVSDVTPGGDETPGTGGGNPNLKDSDKTLGRDGKLRRRPYQPVQGPAATGQSDAVASPVAKPDVEPAGSPEVEPALVGQSQGDELPRGATLALHPPMMGEPPSEEVLSRSKAFCRGIGRAVELLDELEIAVRFGEITSCTGRMLTCEVLPLLERVHASSGQHLAYHRMHAADPRKILEEVD